MMDWEVVVGEFALLTFLFFSGQAWVLIPALLLLTAGFLSRPFWKPVAILMALSGSALFLISYSTGPSIGGGLFLSFLIVSEYLWRGKGPWRDWVALSALLLFSNSAVFSQGPLFLLLALVFVAINLLRLYSRLYPRGRLLWKFLAVHLGTSLLIAPLIFLFTPRKGFMGLGPSLVSGPSSSVNLNFSGEILQSSEIFMEIRGRNIPTYWKGRVFYIYKEGRWSNPFRGRAKTGKSRIRIKPKDLLTVRLYSPRGMMLPLPTGAWSVILQRSGYWSFGHFIEFTKPTRLYQVFPSPGEIMVLRPAANGEFVLLGKENPSAKARTRIFLPSRSAQKVRELAKKLKGKSLKETLENIRAYLNQNYRYTLKVEKRGRDPLEGFLFITRRGHCELFATAAAALLYAMGWDTRLVSGFRVVERGEKWAIVRMMDAHAWVQVWDGRKWVNFDPSPTLTRRERFLPMKGILSKIQLLWDKYISGFSYYNQFRIFLWLRENLRWIALTGVLLIGLIWVGRLGLSLPDEKEQRLRKEKENRRRRPWYYRRMLRLIPAKKPPWQTPMEFAKVLGQEAQLITFFYYRERFGKIPPDRRELKKIREALAKIENRFKRSKGAG